jgi:hypothetical protein
MMPADGRVVFTASGTHDPVPEEAGTGAAPRSATKEASCEAGADWCPGDEQLAAVSAPTP